MSSPSQQRSPFIRLLDAFLQEENIKWILGLGVCILLGSSLRLVTLHWVEYTPVWKYLVLLGYTVAVHCLGQFGYHRLGLRKTGTVLMSLTVLLIPLTFLSLHWIQPRDGSLFADGAWNAGLCLLLGLNLVGSAFAANRIFTHFLRKPQVTFLACYLILCLAGAIVPGLPTVLSPMVSLVLWAVFMVGTIKVNRHVFWLTEEHHLPRIFGFFPIALLGVQFSAVFALGVASHLTVPWLGLLCTLVSLPILMSADAVARVFEQRTGGLVRPFPWSISGPLILGTLLNVEGVLMALSGWPAQTLIVPTAIIAAVSLGIVARRTRKMAFAWGTVAMVLIAYQTSPALAKELVLQLRDRAAAAVNEQRLPYAFYGLTYAPLIAVFSVVAARLRRTGNPLFGIPLQVTATCLSLGLFAVSFTHPSAVFPVALVLALVFIGQLILFGQRAYSIPAVATLLAAAFGLPGFAERVLSWPMTPQSQLLLWTVTAGLLLMPGALFDRWSQRFRRSTGRTIFSVGLDHVCQLFSLASTLIAAGIWTAISLNPVLVYEPGLMSMNAVTIGLLLATQALRWLKPGLGDVSLMFVTYAAQWYLTGYDAWPLTAFDTICGLLLIQWGISYVLRQFNTNRFSRAYGGAVLRVSSFGLAYPFCGHVLIWLSVHHNASVGNWTMSLLLMAWALDAARRISSRALAAVVWCALFVLVSAICTAQIGVPEAFSWWMTIWTMTGVALVGFRRLILAIAVRTPSPLADEGVSEPSPWRQKIATWVEPIAGLLPLLFAWVAIISLFYLDWPQRVAGVLALGGLLAMDRGNVRTAILSLAGPLLNWHILVGVAGVGTGETGLVTSLTAADLSLVALPLAALAAISCLVFEWRLVRDRINLVELIRAHQVALVGSTILMLTEPFRSNLLFTWNVGNIACAVMAFAALTIFAVRSAIRTRDSGPMWLAEITIGLAVLYFAKAGCISWLSPELMYAVLGAGLLHSMAAKWTARSESLAVLFEPLRLTGFWLPALVVPLALFRNFDSAVVDWAGSNSLPLLGAATFYFWQGLEQRRVGTLFLSAAILNIAFVLLWANLGWTDPQLFMIPIGISILAVTELLRTQVPAEYHLNLRMIGSMTILVSPVFHIVTGSWLHILTLMIASTALALMAIGLRIRSLLYTSTAFLLADLVALIARSSADEPNILWIAGIALGIAILAIGAVCENHREQVLARLRCLAAELEQWS